MTPPAHPAPEIAEVVAEMRAAADCGPDESILPSWLLATADRLESLVSGAADTAQRRYENQSKGWRNAPPWDELNADAKQLWIEHAARFPQALAQHSPATGEAVGEVVMFPAFMGLKPGKVGCLPDQSIPIGTKLYAAPPTPSASGQVPDVRAKIESLLARLRPNIECAPWVIAELKTYLAPTEPTEKGE